MGVTLDVWSAALHRAFEFEEATAELVVKLLLAEQFVASACECALGRLQLFPQQRDGRLGLAVEAYFEVFDLIGEAKDEADDAVNTLVVEPVDVCLSIHRSFS
jgi:hypothetical protein